MGMFDDLIPQGSGGDARSQIGKPEELTFAEKLVSGVKLPDWMENLRGTAPVRVLQGMADPMIGGMQLAANAFPDSTGVPQAVNKRVGDLEADYQRQRLARTDPTLSSLVTGKQDPGTDWSRIAGNVLSPVNAAIGGVAGVAETAGARALQGLAVGAAGGATAPVADTSSGYWGKKTGEIAMGAATGAVLTPVLGKVAEVAMRKLGIGATANVKASTHDVDNAVVEALKETGQSIQDIPPDQLQALRTQVSTALTNGQTINPAAALRKTDFEALGVQPTLGQITREPMQFAREQNLRGVEGVGEPLSARFADQGNALQAALPQGGAKPAYQAGTQISESLAKLDDTLRKHVSGLYGEARASAGKDLELPTDSLANTYQQVLATYGQRNVPDPVRKAFAAALLPKEPLPGENFPSIFRTLDTVAKTQPGPGIARTLESAASELGPHGYGAPLSRADYQAALPQNMARPGPKVTFEDADSLRKLINEHVTTGPNANGTMNTALGKLRAALNEAQGSADASGGPFAPAVRGAAERFKMHDAIPALKAAADGSVAPDDFVRRFIVNGKTNEVRGLAQVLKQADPQSYQEARAQLGDELRRAAFGEVNGATGDSPFSPARYMKTIRSIGPDKLSAFFDPQEVTDILRVGRVGAYIKSAPNASAVNSSNTAGAVMNLASKIPGMSPLITIGNRAVSAVKNNNAVRDALAGNVPTGTAPLSDAQRNYLAYILAGGAGASGAIAR